MALDTAVEHADSVRDEGWSCAEGIMANRRTALFRVMSGVLLAVFGPSSVESQPEKEPQSTVEYVLKVIGPDEMDWSYSDEPLRSERNLKLTVAAKESDEPIRKILLTAFAKPASHYGWAACLWSPKTFESTEGVYELTDLPLRDTYLLVDVDGYSPEAFLFAADEKEEELRVEPRPQLTIRGRMVDGTTGEALAGKRFTFDGFNGLLVPEFGYRMITDEYGRFELRDMPQGEYFIGERYRFDAYCQPIDESQPERHKVHGSLPASKPPFYDIPRFPEIQEKAPNLLDYGDIMVPRAAMVTVTVRDGEGNPMGGIPLRVTGPTRTTDHATSYEAQFRTDEQGVAAFGVRRLGGKVPMAVWVSGTDDQKYRNPIYDHWKPMDHLTPESVRDHMVEHGRVYLGDSDEELLKRAEGMIEHLRRTYEAEAGLPPHPFSEVIMISPSEVFDIEMTYSEEAAGRPGPLEVVDAETGKPITSIEGYIFRTANETDASFLATGRVRYTSAGASPVIMDRPELVPRLDGIRDDGIYPIPPDFSTEDWSHVECYSIGIDSPGYARQVVRISPERLLKDKPLRLELRPEASFAGRLVDAETGRPVDISEYRGKSRSYGVAMPVQLWNEAVPRIDHYDYQPDAGPEGMKVYHAHELAMRSSADGTLEADSLPADPNWNLTVEVAGYGVCLRTMDLKIGGNDGGDIPLQRPGSLAGRILDEEDRPVAGATVYIRSLVRDHSQPMPSVHDKNCQTTDAEGRFRLSLEEALSTDQILRVVPPWGIDTNPAAASNMERQPGVIFDFHVDLDPGTKHEQDFVIAKGSDLAVVAGRVHDFEALVDEIVRLQALDPYSQTNRSEVQPSLFSTHYLLISTDSRDRIRLYHQHRPLPGAPFSASYEEDYAFTVPDVPPGEYLILVSGEFAMPGQIDVAYSYAAYPLFVAKFSMGEGDGQLSLERKSAFVVCSLSPESFPELRGGYSTVEARVPGYRTTGPFRLWEDMRRWALDEVVDSHVTTRRRISHREEYYTEVFSVSSGSYLGEGSETIDLLVSLPAGYEYVLELQQRPNQPTAPWTTLARTRVEAEEGETIRIDLDSHRLVKALEQRE